MTTGKSKETCSVENCERVSCTRGMCKSHYESWRKVNRSEVKSKIGLWNNPDGSRKTCLEDDCSEPVESLGRCRYHYHAARYEDGRGQSVARKNRKLRNPDGSRTPLPCQFEGCVNNEFNPGLCAGHYYQSLRGEELRPLRERFECPVPGCAGSFNDKLSRSRCCGRCAGRMKRFSLSLEELIALFTPLVCSNPGCDSAELLRIDHDHSCCPEKGSCGECVRGLLCNGCNTSLGSLHEDPRRIRGLVNYLEGFKGA